MPGTVVRVVQTQHDGSGVRVGVGFGRAEALQGSGAAVWSQRVVPGTTATKAPTSFTGLDDPSGGRSGSRRSCPARSWVRGECAYPPHRSRSGERCPGEESATRRRTHKGGLIGVRRRFAGRYHHTLGSRNRGKKPGQDTGRVFRAGGSVAPLRTRGRAVHDEPAPPEVAVSRLPTGGQRQAGGSKDYGRRFEDSSCGFPGGLCPETTLPSIWKGEDGANY